MDIVHACRAEAFRVRVLPLRPENIWVLRIDISIGRRWFCCIDIDMHDADGVVCSTARLELRFIIV